MVPATLSLCAVRVAMTDVVVWVDLRSFFPLSAAWVLAASVGEFSRRTTPGDVSSSTNPITLPPPESEGAAHHLPVTFYGYVLPYLVVRPSQRVLHLLVALCSIQVLSA
jgi:hypothetical protein